MILLTKWILIIIVEVQFALTHKMDTMQTARFETQAECESTKEKLLDAFPEIIDAAWCERE